MEVEHANRAVRKEGTGAQLIRHTRRALGATVHVFTNLTDYLSLKKKEHVHIDSENKENIITADKLSKVAKLEEIKATTPYDKLHIKADASKTEIKKAFYNEIRRTLNLDEDASKKIIADTLTQCHTEMKEPEYIQLMNAIIEIKTAYQQAISNLDKVDVEDRVYKKVTIYDLSGNYLGITKINKHGLEIHRNYMLTGKLGEGGSGEAYEYTPITRNFDGSYRPDHTAKKKVIKKAFNSTQAQEDLHTGSQVLNEQMKDPITGQKLRIIPGLVKNMKYLDTTSHAGILTHYNMGDLFLDRHKPPMGTKEMFNMAGQLCFGLRHLHTESKHKPARIHRDIKGKNIFHRRNRQGAIEYAIADVDGAHRKSNVNARTTYTSYYIEKKDYTLMKRKGMSYRDHKQFNASLDIYGLGLTLRSKASGMPIEEFVTHAYSKSSDRWNIKKIDSEFSLASFPKKYLNSLSPEETIQLQGLCNIINDMTAADWRDRPTADEVVNQLEQLGIPVPTYPTA